jgi:hypothetical protein
MRRLRKVVTRGLVAAGMVTASFLLCLVGLEFGLRLAGIGSDQFLRQDPVLGVSFIPGKRGLSQGTCFRTSVTINSHGWRSGEVEWTKPDEIFRVLMLGDSFVAALQVEDNQTMSAVAEDQLNRAGLSKRIEFINMGVPSFGIDQEYIAFREIGAKYDPDLVVLAVFAQNDVKGNSIVLERLDSSYPKPFFDIKDDQLVKLPFVDRTPYWIAKTRQLVRPLRAYPFTRDALMKIPLLHEILYDLGIIGVVPRGRDKEARGGEYPTRWGRQSAVFASEYSDPWLNAWEITKVLIAETKRKANDLDAEFLLLGVADPISVMPAEVLEQVLPADIRADLDRDKPIDLLRDFAKSAGIDFLTLVPRFRTEIGESAEAFKTYYLPCDGHWSAAGNMLAAETLAAYLKPIIERRLAP